MAVVYRHRRLDNHEVFYVGIGKTEKRAYSKWNRNAHWKNITSKYGYNVELLAEDLSWEDACELECFLIGEYGRKDLGTGRLVNMTDGGEGLFNPSQETRKKMRDAKAGKPQSPSHISSMKEATKHMKQPIMQYDLQENFIKEYEGVREASRELNMGYRQLQRVLRGERSHTRGFVFRYKK